MQLSFKIETFRIHLFLKMVSGGMKMIKILIVEDELPISKLIEMNLNDAGICVHAPMTG